jgi:hypothetical protein
MTFSCSPPPMKMGGVATIDLRNESIVGYSKGTNAHGYLQERRNRGYQNSIFIRRVPVLSCSYVPRFIAGGIVGLVMF